MKNQKYKLNNKRILIKILNIFCYFFTSIGILFCILISVFSCSSQSVDHKEINAINENQNQFVQRQNVGFQLLDNDTVGYPLDSGSLMRRPSTLALYSERIYNYTVSLGSTEVACVRDSNDSIVMLDEQWNIYFNLHYPLRANDYIRFETENWTRVYSVSLYDDTFYISQQIAPENYLYNDIYLPVTLSYTSENYQRFKTDLDLFFYQLDFTDFQLNNKWNPLVYFPSQADCFLVDKYDNQYNDLIISNSVFGQSFKILDSTLFSINGQIYTDLLIRVQTIQAPFEIDVYYDNYSDFKEYISGQMQVSKVYFPDLVYAYNNNTERYTVIWNQPFDDNNNTYSIYRFERGFVNPNTSRIRLFDRHLGYTVLHSYTNANALLVEGTAIYGQGQGSTFDALSSVFTLISSAFSSFVPMLNLTIGSGITLLSLILIPITVYMIFAIIHLFKR